MPLTPEDRKPRMLWGQEFHDENVYEAALERVRHAYNLFDTVVVMFSGGKDSTAVLETALVVAEELDRLPLKVIFYDEEAIPFETEEYVRRRANDPRIDLDWYCLPVKHRNACSLESPEWYPWAPEAEHLWCRPMPPEAITEVDGFEIDPPERRLSIPETATLVLPQSRELGTVARLMGIRADESITRRSAVIQRRLDNFIIRQTPWMAKVYPVYDWSSEDVWVAPTLLGWDINEAYSRMSMAGLRAHHQRCAPPFGEEPMQLLYMYKTAFPELWAKMSERVPGASTAALYSRSDLYSFKGVEPPPEGKTWMEHITSELDKQDPEIRKAQVYKIRNLIERHYATTDDPILDVPHFDTGLGYHGLYIVAARGDMKGRRPVVKMALSHPDYEPRKQKYLRALEAFRRGDKPECAIRYGGSA